MEQSQEIKDLSMALSKAQSKFTNILKTNTARIRTKSGAEFSYSYADLASLLDMVRGPLTENQLAITQCSDTIEGKVIIETLLLHSTGQFLKNKLTLPLVETGNNAIQAIGSSITYGRRYEISSILGISSEEDTDTAEVAVKAAPAKSSPAPQTRETLYKNGEPAKRIDVPPIPTNLTLRGMLEKIAIEKFGSLDDFQVWRIQNGHPDSLNNLKDFDLAKIMTAVREYGKEAKNGVHSTK